MSKNILRLAPAVLFALFGNAYADQFDFSNPGNVTWNGVYVNPYIAINSTEGHVPANQPLAIYCDDWNTDFWGNPKWNANVYSLQDALISGNISKLRFGNTTLGYNVSLDGHGALDYHTVDLPLPTDRFGRYLEAAYLDFRLETELANQDPSTNVRIGLAAAQWTLFVDDLHVAGLIGSINNSGYANDVFNYLQEAQDAVGPHGTFNGDGWDIIVPIGLTDANGPMQEFLYHTLVPEPGAVVLLGGIIGLLAVKKLRHRHQG